MAPKCSVLFPADRPHAYLGEAVRSILNQDFRDFELLIIDNSPNRAVEELVSSVGDPRVRYLNVSIRQLPLALNVGLMEARAEYVARMDSDDISLPTRLGRQVQFLDNNPHIALVGTNYIRIDEYGRPLQKQPTLPCTPERVRSRRFYESAIAHPTVMFRRSVVLELSGYAGGLFAEDYDLWLRMHRKGLLLTNLPTVELKYRVHGGQSMHPSRAWVNAAHVASMQVREFLLTGHPAFLIGAGRSLFYGAAFVIRSRISGRLRSRIDATAGQK